MTCSRFTCDSFSLVCLRGNASNLKHPVSYSKRDLEKKAYSTETKALNLEKKKIVQESIGVNNIVCAS